MKEEKINSKQLNALILLFTLGLSLLFGGASAGMQDCWIAIILGVFLIIPITRIYTRLLIEHPGKDLYEILEITCGKVIGKVLIVVYIWFAVHSATLTYLNIVDFINFVGLPTTPIIVILLPIVLLSMWICKKGLVVLGRWSVFFLWIVLFLGVGSVILLVPIYDFNNFRPVLSSGFLPIFQGVVSVVGISFSGLIMFAFFGGEYDCPKEFREIFEKSVLLAGGIIFVLSVQNILVLGVQNNMRAYFPGYESYRRIRVGTAFQRMESIVTVIFVISEFVRASIFMIAAGRGIRRLFGLKFEKFLITPIACICINLYFIEYQSIMVGIEYAIEVWPFYSAVVNIGIPLAVLMVMYIKKIKTLIKSVN